MSTQSGIAASKDLLEAFRHLALSSLVVTISDDSTELVQDSSYTPLSSSDLDAVFHSLKLHFAENHPQPGYAIVPRAENEYAFISFIPDVAPIRQKMLFASTKNTLIQQLGYSFGKTYILALSELEELTAAHYKHATTKDDGVLSSDEKVLEQMNNLHNLTLSQEAFGKKELASMHTNLSLSSVSSGALFFKIDGVLEAVLRGDLSEKLVTMNIDSSETLVLKSETSGVRVSTLIETAQKTVDLSSPSPLYALFGYAPQKLAFIYLCPSGSKVRERMVYAANKLGLIAHLKGDYFSSGQIEHVLEVGDLDELDVSKLEPAAGSAPSVSNALKFSKPKGPRRR